MILTHTMPDLDAVASTWLLARYLPGGEHLGLVSFTSERNPDAAVYHAKEPSAVCDIGGICDEARLWFDHHQDPSLPSATVLVYNYLIKQGVDIAHLAPLVELVDAGDWGRPEARLSYQLGLHALHNACLDNAPGEHYAVWRYTAGLLDALAARLLDAQAKRDSLDGKVRWKSDDGLVWAITEGDKATGAAAAARGARLVVYVDPYERDGRRCYSVGCWRYGEKSPHVGDIVANAAARAWLDSVPLYDELARWYRHPAGFFAGIGGGKSEPRWDAPAVSVEEMAQAIDREWQRDAPPRPGEIEVPPYARPSACKSCGKSLAWALVEGRRVPLSLETAQRRGGKDWALSHFTDCPDAAAWRGGKR